MTSGNPLTSTARDRAGRGAADGATFLLKGDAGTTFPAGRTALLVIDPVNDFLSEGGAAWDLTRNTVRIHNVVANLRRAIDGAREKAIPVFFAPMAYTAEDYLEHELHRRNGIHRVQFERKMFLAGSWGADFHPDLQPQPSDVVLLPHKGTDVFRTDLPEHLERLGTTHLILCGMTANLCVESTARHAAEAGYDVTFLADAIGSENVPSYEAAVRVNFPLIGNAVMKVDEFLSAITAFSERHQVKPGDLVRGSDHLPVGKVRRVEPATETHAAHMIVEQRLLFFKRRSFIPVDAITKRTATTVFINVPRLVLSKMPWRTPPQLSDRRQMEGPPSESVAKLYASRAPTEHESQLRNAADHAGPLRKVQRTDQP